MGISKKATTEKTLTKRSQMDFTLSVIAKTLKKNGLKLFSIKLEPSHTSLLLIQKEISSECLLHKTEKLVFQYTNYSSVPVFPEVNMSQPPKSTLIQLSLESLINNAMTLKLQSLSEGSIIWSKTFWPKNDV